jgi:hypothetical protein
LTGDAVGEIAYNYGLIYNNAFIIVEDIGGYGSATLLTLLNLKYDNLYYDDPALKNYTAQNEASPIKVTKDGLPGFHSSSVRFQMLSNFANLVKTNQFKIRSSRVVNELSTWVFKNGRIDHKDGCHDDTLTCLAMVLFVMEYSINRQMKVKEKDKVILQSMININNRIVRADTKIKTNNPQGKSFPLMLYMDKKQNANAVAYNANMWLFSNKSR